MSLERSEIEALLPFLANGTLDGVEEAEVKAAVAADAGLQAELATLTAVRAHMQHEELETSPGELGLARLMRDVDGAAQDAPASNENTAPDNVVPLTRLRLWQAAAAVLLTVGIGQTLFLQGPGPMDQAAVPSAPQAVAERAATPELSTAEAEDFALAGAMPVEVARPVAFRALFAEGVTEAEMRELLLEAGVEIVAGPSAIGFYDLALLDGPEGQEAALAVLEAASGDVIDALEPL